MNSTPSDYMGAGRIIVADDDPSMATGLKGLIERMGFHVPAVATTGAQAVELCRQYLPDLIVMDVIMPQMDGLEAARQITHHPGTPILVLTAFGDHDHVERAIDAEVANFLMKPVHAEALRASIELTLARARELNELRDNVERLETNLRDRKIIERAKGMVMDHKDCREQEAYAMMRRCSQDRRISMAALARLIIDGEQSLDL